MRAAATLAYQSMRDKYPASPARANSALGLMRIAYRENDLAATSKWFEVLNAAKRPIRLNPAPTISWARPLSGLQKNYTDAIKYLSAVPETHPEHIYAQHSLGIANLVQGNDPAKAHEAFLAAVRSPATTEARKTRHRTYLLWACSFTSRNSLEMPRTHCVKYRKTVYTTKCAAGAGLVGDKIAPVADCMQAATT